MFAMDCYTFLRRDFLAGEHADSSIGACLFRLVGAAPTKPSYPQNEPTPPCDGRPARGGETARGPSGSDGKQTAVSVPLWRISRSTPC